MYKLQKKCPPTVAKFAVKKGARSLDGQPDKNQESEHLAHKNAI